MLRMHRAEEARADLSARAEMVAWFLRWLATILRALVHVTTLIAGQDCFGTSRRAQPMDSMEMESAMTPMAMPVAGLP